MTYSFSVSDISKAGTKTLSSSNRLGSEKSLKNRSKRSISGIKDRKLLLLGTNCNILVISSTSFQGVLTLFE